MSILLFLGGILLVMVAMFDALWTTVGFSGGGPVTQRLAGRIWKGVLRIHRARGGTSHGLLKATGTVILLATVAFWIVAVGAGYLCIFSAGSGAIVHSQTGEEADFAERLYFTGYTLVTLGMGDYVPAGDAWRVMTVAASLNGLFLVTLAITYLLPIVSAAAHKHQLGAAVSNLGDTPERVLIRAWDGQSFNGLGNHLVQITQMIDLHAQYHLAYPILHYFHTVTRHAAAAPGLVVLYDALLILSEGVEKSHRPPAIAIEPAQRALDHLIEILKVDYVDEASEAPPLPELGRLRALQMPVGSDGEFRERAQAAQTQRSFLKAHLENSGWAWEAVTLDAPPKAS